MHRADAGCVDEDQSSGGRKNLAFCAKITVARPPPLVGALRLFHAVAMHRRPAGCPQPERLSDMIRDIALDEIVAVCSDARRIVVQPGEVLFREGDDGSTMYIVTRGTMRILSGSSIFETVHDGGIVGEMAIVEDNVPRSATVIAGTRCELIEIDVSQFLALVASVPAFSITVMRVIARRLRVMNRRHREVARRA
jgi:CRP/FNR family transcriptional regulator, cyclic AMP receptor protein